MSSGKPSLAERFAQYAVPAASVADFLERYYKPERRAPVWDPERPERLVRSYEEEVARYGYCFISHHDSITGTTVSWQPAAIPDAPCNSEVGLMDFQGTDGPR